MKDFKQIKRRKQVKEYSYIFSVNRVCVYTCGKTTYLIALTRLDALVETISFGSYIEIVSYDQRCGNDTTSRGKIMLRSQ